MTDDPLQRVLRLVADGRLTAEEAGPILDALEARESPGSSSAGDAGRDRRAGGSGPSEPRFARIEVVEGGRKAVDLRVPLSLGRRVLSAIPGLSAAQTVEIEEAVARGLSGPIVDIQDDEGDAVRIVLE